MPGPEAIARESIDRLLEAAGWVLQDRDQFDRTAATGVAVREFPIATGPCDYLLWKMCRRRMALRIESDVDNPEELLSSESCHAAWNTCFNIPAHIPVRTRSRGA